MTQVPGILYPPLQLFAAKPPLDEDFSEDDLVSSACSSRRGSVTSVDYLQTSITSLPVDRGEREATSKAFRRRSSTSDALRFREKLQELSCSADMHDDMMGESPREHSDEQDSSSPPGETAGNEQSANTNSNNNSPVDTVNLKERTSHTRPTMLFGAQFRGHVRASSDTSTITKTSATSKLTEVHVPSKDVTSVEIEAAKRTSPSRKTETPTIQIKGEPNRLTSPSGERGRPTGEEEVGAHEPPLSPHRKRGTPSIDRKRVPKSPVSPRRKRAMESESSLESTVRSPTATGGIPMVEIDNPPEREQVIHSQGDVPNGNIGVQPPAPGVQNLNVPKGKATDKHSLDTDSMESSTDSTDRKSAIVDIGYDF